MFGGRIPVRKDKFSWTIMVKVIVRYVFIILTGMVEFVQIGKYLSNLLINLIFTQMYLTIKEIIRSCPFSVLDIAYFVC